MKQFALLLALLLCLTACTASPGEGAPETTKQETTAADETTPEVTEPEANGDDVPELIDNAWIEAAETDFRYKTIVAFLQKDVEELAAMDWAGYGETSIADEMLSEIRSITFGSCSVTEQPAPDTLRFQFEITESDCSYFPVGQYDYDVKGGIGNPYWRNRKVVDCPADLEICHAMAQRYVSYSFYYQNTVEGSHCDEGVFMSIFAKFYREHEEYTYETGIPAEYIRTTAYEIFGIDDFTPPETESIAIDGGYQTMPRGGLTMTCDLMQIQTEDDSLKFVFQLYADYGGIVPSHTVEVSFAKAEGDFGYVFGSAKITSAGAYAPFGFFL